MEAAECFGVRAGVLARVCVHVSLLGNAGPPDSWGRRRPATVFCLAVFLQGSRCCWKATPESAGRKGEKSWSTTATLDNSGEIETEDWILNPFSPTLR